MRSNILVLLAVGLLALAGCRSQGYYDSLVYDSQSQPNVRPPTVPTPEEQEEEEIEEARREAEEARREAERARREAERLQRELDAAQDSRDDNAQEPENTPPPDEQQPQNPPPAEPSAKEVKAALDGLRIKPSPLSPPTVTPEYRAPASVTIPGVAFANPHGYAYSGHWYVTSLSNRGASSQDTMLIYSDVAHEFTPIADEYPFIRTLDGRYLVITIDTNTSDGNMVDHSGVLASDRFPSVASTIRLPVNTAKITVWFPGTFDGVSGSFQCDGGTNAMPCSVQHDGTKYVLGDGTWTFRTALDAMVKGDDDDMSFMHFGWWRKQTIPDGAFEYSVFSGRSATAPDVNSMHFPALTGTAAYTGPAIGQYAIKPPAGELNFGSFRASVQLSADFGDAAQAGSISGVVTNFNVNRDWTVTLMSADMMTNGTIAQGNVSWTIGGSTKAGGKWNGTFHHESMPGEGDKPEGIAGTFDAQYDDAGRMVGAFGATR